MKKVRTPEKRWAQRKILTSWGIGKWIAEIPIPQGMSLEKSELRLRGKNKEVFLDLMRGMLQWRPEDRKTAKQLLEHPWLNKVIEWKLYTPRINAKSKVLTSAFSGMRLQLFQSMYMPRKDLAWPPKSQNPLSRYPTGQFECCVSCIMTKVVPNLSPLLGDRLTPAASSEVTKRGKWK